MSPIITRNQTAVCPLPPFAQFTPSAPRNCEEIDSLPRWLTKIAFQTRKSARFGPVFSTPTALTRGPVPAAKKSGRETQNKSGQATHIGSVGCLGPILGSLDSCKRSLRLEPTCHSPLLDDGCFRVDPFKRETPGEGESCPCDSGVLLFPPSTRFPLWEMCLISFRINIAFFTHTPPFFELCQITKVIPEMNYCY